MARIRSRLIAAGADQLLSCPKARRNVCGMGPLRLMGRSPTNANTELVPRMNISAMMGAEINTDWPIVRAALLHSPAIMAMYSNPLRAPTVICPKIARLNQLNCGTAQGVGVYVLCWPLALLHKGRMSRAAYEETEELTKAVLCLPVKPTFQRHGRI